MRKTMLSILVLVTLALAGCSETTPEPTIENSTVTPAETATPVPTATPEPTEAPTATPVPTATSTPIPTVPLVEFERSRTYPDNTYQNMDSYYVNNTSAPQGTVVTFTYDTKNHLKEDDTIYQKSALVYLPAGYDETDTETHYNILYLMHGGGDSPKWYLGSDGKSSRITRMLDNMIEKGDIEPLIVCAVSYYNDYSNDATKNCINFHYELMNDLIPALETTYPTYAENITAEGLAASRTHRAFGGFSMGAVTTWSVFEHCLNEFAYFLPMSGDCWALGQTAGSSKSLQTASHLASVVAEAGKTAEDFFIYSGCGENDIAEPNLTPQIKMMKLLPDTFIYCDNFANGNLYECIYPNGGHDVRTVSAVMYNGLPKFFH